jgi:hypothetical protein
MYVAINSRRRVCEAMIVNNDGKETTEDDI